MSNLKMFFIFSLLMTFAQSASGEGAADLRIAVDGFADDQGQIVVNLFRAGSDVMKVEQAYMQTTGSVSGRRAQLLFKNVAYGKYAAIVFHDRNGNGLLDHNFLHFPAEQLGFSNGFRLGALSGLPSFEKLEFAFGPGRETVEIRLH